MIRYEPMLFGLVQVLGGLHLAVGLTAAEPRIPLAVAAGLGAAAFFASGKFLRGRPPAEQAAWGYGLPLAACGAVLFLAARPPDWDRALTLLVRLVAVVWERTPVPLYLLALAYAVTRKPPALPANRRPQPPR